MGKCHHQRLGSNGFTLVEMLITLALMAVVSVPISAALIFGLRVYDSEVEVDRAFSSQQTVLMAIKNQVRANPAEVKLIPLENGEFALEIGKDQSLVRYYQDGNQLYQLTNNTLSVILSDVKTFAFEDIEENTGHQLTSFTIKMVSTKQGREQTLTATIALDRY